MFCCQEVGDHLNEEQIAPIIKEIKGALPEVEEDKIRKEIERYLQYGIEMQEAKRSIIRKFGGVETQFRSVGPLTLKEIQGDGSNFDLTVKCLSASERMQRTQNGDKMLASGLIADGSMIRRFVSWDGHSLEKGKAYNINRASARTYRGEVEVNLGSFTQVEEAEEGALQDLDIDKLPRFGTLNEIKLREIRPGMGNLQIMGKILGVEARNIEVEGGKKKIFDGVIADETHRLRFTAWHDFGLDIDEVVTIRGAYVKEWRGIPQINFDDRAQVTREEIDIEPVTTPKMRAEELIEAGASDVLVEGTVIEVRDGSGLIYRCPLCNRALMNGSCSVHGAQEGTADLRAKIVLDDGTGALFAILNTEITEELLGLTVSDAIRKFQPMDQSDMVALNKVLLGKEFVLRGNVIRDDFGPTVLPSSITPVDMDCVERARDMLSDLEGF